MNYLSIIKYAVTLLVIVYSIVATIISIVREKKQNKTIANTKSENDENKIFFDKLNSKIISAMSAVEPIYNALSDPLGVKLPEMKENDVKRQVKDFCEEENKEYNAEYVTEKIKELIAFSKIVNNPIVAKLTQEKDKKPIVKESENDVEKILEGIPDFPPLDDDPEYITIKEDNNDHD